MRLLLLLLTSMVAQAATVTLGGVTYTMRDHPRVMLDGPGGTLTTSVTAGGSRAVVGNPLYTNLTPATTLAINEPYVLSPYFGLALAAALKWQATGDAAALAVAKARVNDASYWLQGHFACDSSQAYCGDPGIDYTRYYVGHAVQVYSIIYSELTPAERQAFADKILNDNDDQHNGLNPTGQGCTPQPIYAGAGTLTDNSVVPSATSTTITASGGTAQFAVGDVIVSSTTTATITRVVQIVDGSTITVNKAVNWSGFSFRRIPSWTTGNCGVVWVLKHHSYTPHLIPAQSAHYTADYPTTGGVSENPQHNLILTAHFAFIPAGLGLCGDDQRACDLLRQSYDYWQANNYVWHRSQSTGFTSGGPSYTNGRINYFNSFIVLMLRNSLVSGPDFTDGVWLKRIAPYYYYMYNMGFQDIYAPVWASWTTFSFLASMHLYPSADETKYGHYWLRNTYVSSSTPGDWTTRGIGGGNSPHSGWFYILYDPGWASANVTGAPKQYLFRANDYDICVAQGLACKPNAAYTHAYSHTGFGTTDTRVLLQSPYNDVQDHSGAGDWGSVHIDKGQKLLGGDYQTANGNKANDNVVEIGSAGWANTQGGQNYPSYATITRWAGADPTGPASSDYAYALSDFAGAYPVASGVARAQRSVVHFKKAGSQDYVVWYDDIAAGVAPIKAYLHFFHSSCLNKPTCALGASGITWGGDGTVINTQSASRLLTNVLPVAGTNTVLLSRDATDGTYAGGRGYTYRAFACPEDPGNPGVCNAGAASGEWIVINAASTNTSATMPTIAQPACTGTGGNCAVTEIQDATTPKVALFARGGAQLRTATFTSTHSGTAQYVLAGMAAGFGAVLRNGVPISGSPFTVTDGDNTIYFEGLAGSYVVSNGPALTVAPIPLTLSCVSGQSASGSIAVSAAGLTLADWSASKAAAWLTLSPASGSAAGSFTATADCAGLAAGAYSDTISVSSTDGVANSPVAVAVSLSVTPVPPPVGIVPRGVWRGRIGR